jgi:hypothetical protein
MFSSVIFVVVEFGEWGFVGHREWLNYIKFNEILMEGIGILMEGNC